MKKQAQSHSGAADWAKGLKVWSTLVRDSSSQRLPFIRGKCNDLMQNPTNAAWISSSTDLRDVGGFC